jgi:hypothetical protein
VRAIVFRGEFQVKVFSHLASGGYFGDDTSFSRDHFIQHWMTLRARFRQCTLLMERREQRDACRWLLRHDAKHGPLVIPCYVDAFGGKLRLITCTRNLLRLLTYTYGKKVI